MSRTFKDEKGRTFITISFGSRYVCFLLAMLCFATVILIPLAFDPLMTAIRGGILYLDENGEAV